jgi:hypothetical protein
MLTQEGIPAFLAKWIQSHIAAAANLTTGIKPVLFEVFERTFSLSSRPAW